MKRAVFALAIAAGLAIGIAIPSAAIGETQVTLNCDDGTSTTLRVDADTLAGLTQAVQAMIDYPAGLSCTLVKVPLVGFGMVALASPGNSSFIVGGGRWDVPCDAILLPPPPGPCPPDCGAIEPPAVARAPGALLARPTAVQPSDQTVSVNIAVNFHQRNDGSFFGTLNETIPANQFCDDQPVGETHFTSKPQPSPPGCFGIDPTNVNTAHVVSNVTQTSGQQSFPNGSGGPLIVGDLIHFSFTDNGNPGHQPPGVDDMLQGPPAPNDSQCVQDPTTKAVLASGPLPLFHLKNGNITLHP